MIEQFLYVGWLNARQVPGPAVPPVPFTRSTGKKLCILVRLGSPFHLESPPGDVLDPRRAVLIFHSTSSASRFGLRDVHVGVLRLLVQSLEFFLHFFHLFVRKLFKIDKFITRTLKGTDQLVQFQLNGFPVAVLRVLNQEYDQEGYDGGAGVDDKLPRIGKMKQHPGRAPDDDDGNCDNERPRRSNCQRSIPRKSAKKIINPAAE